MAFVPWIWSSVWVFSGNSGLVVANWRWIQEEICFDLIEDMRFASLSLEIWRRSMVLWVLHLFRCFWRSDWRWVFNRSRSEMLFPSMECDVEVFRLWEGDDTVFFYGKWDLCSTFVCCWSDLRIWVFPFSFLIWVVEMILFLFHALFYDSFFMMLIDLRILKGWRLFLGRVFILCRRRRLDSSTAPAFFLNRSFLVFWILSFLFQIYLSWARSIGLIIMSQSMVLGGSNKGKQIMKIKIPQFDNSDLIKGCALSLIGRAMNPRLQDLSKLIKLMPKFWKMEDRVVGSELGLGRIQFDFQSEDDLLVVLQLGPFHFDGWMVSLVRWEPIVHPEYPSAITFWIKVLGVPPHFWHDQTFRSIGEGLGVCFEVDVGQGVMRVTVNGFKPLCFETELEFFGGDKTTIRLQYLKLVGFCSICYSLCHEAQVCPEVPNVEKEKSETDMCKGGHRNNRRLREEDDERRLRHEKKPVRRVLEFSNKGNREVFNGETVQREHHGKEKVLMAQKQGLDANYRTDPKDYERQNNREYGDHSSARRYEDGVSGKRGGLKAGRSLGAALSYRRLDPVFQDAAVAIQQKSVSVETQADLKEADLFSQGDQGLAGNSSSFLNSEYAIEDTDFSNQLVWVSDLNGPDSGSNGGAGIADGEIKEDIDVNGIEDGEIKEDIDVNGFDVEFDDLAEFDKDMGFEMEGEFGDDDQLLEEPLDDGNSILIDIEVENGLEPSLISKSCDQTMLETGVFVETEDDVMNGVGNLNDRTDIDDTIKVDDGMEQVGTEGLRDKKGGKKKQGKVSAVLAGVTSKKMNVAILASPKRRTIPKTGAGARDVEKDKSGKVALPKLPAGT